MLRTKTSISSSKGLKKPALSDRELAVRKEEAQEPRSECGPRNLGIAKNTLNYFVTAPGRAIPLNGWPRSLQIITPTAKVPAQ
jgi:hypothetical protein